MLLPLPCLDTLLGDTLALVCAAPLREASSKLLQALLEMPNNVSNEPAFVALIGFRLCTALHCSAMENLREEAIA